MGGSSDSKERFGKTQQDVGGSHEFPIGANEERLEETGGSGELGRWRSWSNRTRKNMDDDIRYSFLIFTLACQTQYHGNLTKTSPVFFDGIND